MTTTLDLSDVIARGRAAMPWTELVDRDSHPYVNCTLRDVPDDRVWDADGNVYPQAERAMQTLCRMRMLDQSVTEHDARAALAWAESGPAAAPRAMDREVQTLHDRHQIACRWTEVMHDGSIALLLGVPLTMSDWGWSDADIERVRAVLARARAMDPRLSALDFMRAVSAVEGARWPDARP